MARPRGIEPLFYWRRLDAEVHLGYRKSERSGTWLVRWRSGRGYKQAPLGAADDVVKVGTLSFAKAETAARSHVEAARVAARALAEGPPLTVRVAIETYCAARDGREGKRQGKPVRSDAAHRLGRYLLGEGRRGETVPVAEIASVPLHRLGEADLRNWRQRLPEDLKPTTRQRLCNDFRAALNAAYAANRERLPMLSETIRHGLRAPVADQSDDPARENQIMSDSEVGKLLRAARQVDTDQGWGGDLFRLLAVLAGTGARLSQAARLRVRDLQADARRLMMPLSRKGRGSKGSGHVPVAIGQDLLEVLIPAIRGRGGDDWLLERWRSRQAPGGIEWVKDRRGPWTSASELTRPWSAVRLAAGLPTAIPYGLRHSSIVRGIRANLPIRLVAAIHDTSVQMIERHYGRWIADGLDELAARAVVPLLPVDDNVVRLVGTS